MTFTPLAQDDPRLRTVCATLTRRELLMTTQQTEINGLLEYVRGTGNKKVPGSRPDAARQSVVGLSANQVGVMKQICVVDLSIGRRGYYDLHVLVNPRIVWRSKALIGKNEGCVNFPNVRGVTRRSRAVTVEAMDRSGNEITLKVTGWAAVLLQHETDHLNGHLFIDRLPDPTQADMVKAGEYQAYRKNSAGWENKADVSAMVRQ